MAFISAVFTPRLTRSRIDRVSPAVSAGKGRIDPAPSLGAFPMPQSKTEKRQAEISKLHLKRAKLQQSLDHYLEVPEGVRSLENRTQIAIKRDDIGRIDHEIERFQSILAHGNSKERRKRQPVFAVQSMGRLDDFLQTVDLA
jgi:hypothetical protein